MNFLSKITLIIILAFSLQLLATKKAGQDTYQEIELKTFKLLDSNEGVQIDCRMQKLPLDIKMKIFEYMIQHARDREIGAIFNALKLINEEDIPANSDNSNALRFRSEFTGKVELKKSLLNNITQGLKKAGIKDFDIVKEGFNGQNRYGETPLHKIALGGYNDIAVFINNGANVNAQDQEGWTPLHNAAECGHLDIARILIEKGARVNIQDKYGRTPLHKSVLAGHFDLVELLLSSDADITIRDNQENTALDIARMRNKFAIVIALEKKLNALHFYLPEKTTKKQCAIM